MRRRSSAGSMSSPPSYDDAVARWQRGEDPMDAPFPMHPSYEARSGVPDRAFPWVSPAQGERMTAAWARLIAGSDAMSRARLLHLHHLTPIHDAVVAAVPDVPVADAPARDRAEDARCDLARRRGSRRRPARRLVGAAACARPRNGRPRPSRSRPSSTTRAVRLLGLDPDTVHCLPNGVDIDRFTPYRPSDDGAAGALAALARTATRRDGTRRARARAACGTTSARCSTRSSTRASGAPRPVLMFVGRFLGFKRVPLLIRAYARARARMAVPVAARHLGRHAGGVGGRASAHRRDTRGRRRGLLHRLARPRRPAARPQLRRLPSSRRRPTSRSGSCTSRRWPASSR